MQHTIKLPDRLQAIADLIDGGASVADIGTDHGFLPVYLAQTGARRGIIASDKSAGSLKAARRSAEKYCVTDKITFIVAPGLTGIDESEADTIVIAGVGGETIIGILEETPWTKNGKRLILQPQTKIDLLLDYLSENGYEILGTRRVSDKGRTYTVMLVVMESGKWKVESGKIGDGEVES